MLVEFEVPQSFWILVFVHEVIPVVDKWTLKDKVGSQLIQVLLTSYFTAFMRTTESVLLLVLVFIMLILRQQRESVVTNLTLELELFNFVLFKRRDFSFSPL